MNARPQSAFTVLELLVTIAIIGMLLALLLPAVQQSRATSRRTHCENNLKQLDLAVLNSTHAMGRFPASTLWGADAKGQSVPMRSWIVAMLPYIERSDIARLWQNDLPLADPTNAKLADIHLSLLACTDDPSITGKGDLSYVVNGGMGRTSVVGGVGDCPVNFSNHPIDLNGNGVTCPQQTTADLPAPTDRDLLTRLGVFFPENWKIAGGTVRHHTPDSILDGLSQTFLMSENVRAGVDPSTPNTNWASGDVTRVGFLLSSRICASLKCSQGNVDYTLANRSPQGINSSLTQPEGMAPWPSSFHTGDGAHFAFGDGHVQFITASIDGRVYAALASAQGTKLDRTPLRQLMVDDANVPE